MLIRRARTAPGHGAARAHTRLLRRRVLTFGAAVAALLSLTLTDAAHATDAAPAAPAAPGYPVVITSVAHTNYLIPDDGAGNEGTYLQVYYRADHPFPRTFEFTPVATAHGQTVYKWTITRTGNCAEVRGDAGTSVYLAKCQDRKSAQWWILRPTTDGSAWALVPYVNENLAVTATYGDDNWAPLREMPGGNATASQLWYLAGA
ncbi:RICIN domain-containing protein [Streptomyces sp. NPDC021212]|uniref:RICIN domain-containing protein n=1 Tax=Streptomyces sp. NPDC021212 TaxID=3365118 RepID=UPI0037A3FFAA